MTDEEQKALVKALMEKAAKTSYPIWMRNADTKQMLGALLESMIADAKAKLELMQGAKALAAAVAEENKAKVTDTKRLDWVLDNLHLCSSTSTKKSIDKQMKGGE